MKFQALIRFLLLFFCLSMMIASAKANMHIGIKLYENRHFDILNDSNPDKNIDKAILFFSNKINDPLYEKEAALYLLKSYYFKGEFILKDTEQKKKIFNEGKYLGEKLIHKFPDSVEYKYWYLVNLGSWAKAYGILTAAYEGVAEIMKKQSEIIIKIDSNYQDGGGYFMLGAVHHKSPYIPFFLSWPNNQDAIKYLQLALNTGFKKLNQKVYLAQALKKNNQINEAKNLLIEVSNAIPDSSNLIEDLFEIEKANNLLQNL